jgi:hypothetical protein
MKGADHSFPAASRLLRDMVFPISANALRLAWDAAHQGCEHVSPYSPKVELHRGSKPT